VGMGRLRVSRVRLRRLTFGAPLDKDQASDMTADTRQHVNEVSIATARSSHSRAEQRMKLM
jgi:hypothetical protein